MTFENRRAVLIDLIDFFQVNDGNKINKYVTGTILNIIAVKLKIEMGISPNKNFQFRDLTIKEKAQEKTSLPDKKVGDKAIKLVDKLEKEEEAINAE